MVKNVFFILLLAIQSFGFSSSGSYGRGEGAKIVLGLQGQNPASPLQFPCLLTNGDVLCDSDLIRIENTVCQRTLHFKRSLNNQYTVSCNTSLSKELILAVSSLDDRSNQGYVHLNLNPQIKLEQIMKPRKNGFGYYLLKNN